ncbi:hypothetical protein [Catenovulum sediminis]|uniref:Fascin domain-containing protein n=1 Tax=Catenovulum sediminis TaxID=1740262 RepID=A0ABV1RF73_9ALTE|nr:hypothetical protein [Catenovulum sediminis]
MIQEQSLLVAYKWHIKTLDGMYLRFHNGEVKLSLSNQCKSADWLFSPCMEVGRYYILNALTGDNLVDTVNGGYDEWSIEPCYNGTQQLVSAGGLFRHFEKSVVQTASSGCAAFRFVEYENWVLETSVAT